LPSTQLALLSTNVADQLLLPSPPLAAQEEELEQLRASAASWQQQAEAAAQASAGQEAAVQQAAEAAVQQAVQPLQEQVRELESKLERRRQKAREAEREAAALKAQAKSAEEGMAQAKEALQDALEDKRFLRSRVEQLEEAAQQSSRLVPPGFPSPRGGPLPPGPLPPGPLPPGPPMHGFLLPPAVRTHILDIMDQTRGALRPEDFDPPPREMLDMPEPVQHAFLEFLHDKVAINGPPKKPLEFVAAWAVDFRP
jgi:hypothetical protein